MHYFLYLFDKVINMFRTSPLSIIRSSFYFLTNLIHLYFPFYMNNLWIIYLYMFRTDRSIILLMMDRSVRNM
jgi:hypothetical protein